MSVGGQGWHIDPISLREVVDDRVLVESTLEVADDVDRIWLLRLLGRIDEAVAAGTRRR